MKTKEIKINELYEELKDWNLDIITTDEVSKRVVDYYNSKDGYCVSGSDGYDFSSMKALRNTNRIHLWDKDELGKVKTEDCSIPVELNTAKADEFEIALQFYITYKTCMENEIQLNVYDKTPEYPCIIVWDGVDKTFEERINKILQLNCVENYVVVSFDELIDLMSKLKELQNNEYFKVINK